MQRGVLTFTAVVGLTVCGLMSCGAPQAQAATVQAATVQIPAVRLDALRATLLDPTTVPACDVLGTMGHIGPARRSAGPDASCSVPLCVGLQGLRPPTRIAPRSLARYRFDLGWEGGPVRAPGTARRSRSFQQILPQIALTTPRQPLRPFPYLPPCLFWPVAGAALLALRGWVNMHRSRRKPRSTP